LVGLPFFPTFICTRKEESFYLHEGEGEVAPMAEAVGNVAPSSLFAWISRGFGFGFKVILEFMWLGHPGSLAMALFAVVCADRGQQTDGDLTEAEAVDCRRGIGRHMPPPSERTTPTLGIEI
jgi:hypothetical protein